MDNFNILDFDFWWMMCLVRQLYRSDSAQMGSQITLTSTSYNVFIQTPQLAPAPIIPSLRQKDYETCDDDTSTFSFIFEQKLKWVLTLKPDWISVYIRDTLSPRPVQIQAKGR